MNREATLSVTRYDVCELGCKAYSNTLSIDNLHSAFRKDGIYEFNRNSISTNSVSPAEVSEKKPPSNL